MATASLSPPTGADRAPEAQDGGELLLLSRQSASSFRTELVVPSMHCGGCMRKVETSLANLPGVTKARANLSTKRVVVEWSRHGQPPALTETLEKIGFPAHVAEIPDKAHDGELRAMLRALAVAAFASSNIMLLSFAVWSGADPWTRQLFHLISGLIALPTVLYSGQVFYRSAWSALKHGRTNMDVPISIGVTLTFVLSVYETAMYGAHAYFDAAVSLLFFLLIGRTLDHMMRARARSAVAGIARLAARGAYLIEPDGWHRYVPLAEVRPGMRLALAAGQRVPVDARIVAGRSEIDCSLTSGESIPVAADVGQELQAGVLNLSAPLEIVALRGSNESFLAEMTRLMETAETGRSGYRRIADRASALYAPVVHVAAFLTFLGWLAAGTGLHHAATTAIAVLIVTCPCALGLAVPMVQVVAAGRLFRGGILIKDGSALERLAEIDTVVFDKTGTLTRGEPELLPQKDESGETCANCWRLRPGSPATPPTPIRAPSRPPAPMRRQSPSGRSAKWPAMASRRRSKGRSTGSAVRTGQRRSMPCRMAAASSSAATAGLFAHSVSRTACAAAPKPALPNSRRVGCGWRCCRATGRTQSPRSPEGWASPLPPKRRRPARCSGSKR